MYESTKVPKTFNNTGVYDAEVPPVLIPNTEVKLSSAESTWLDTAWKDMSMPVPKNKDHTFVWSLFLRSSANTACSRACPTRAWEARRVKQTVLWTVCSQSERGGCLWQRRCRAMSMPVPKTKTTQ